MRSQRAIWVFLLLLTLSGSPVWSQDSATRDLEALLRRLESARDISVKEAALNTISEKYPNAGPQLLRLAERTPDVGTKYLAIRGLGYLKYSGAVCFLIRSLRAGDAAVRATAARALGDMRAASATPALIRLLRREQDGGVIEQTSLALTWLQATEALPVLKSKASHPSAQTRVWILQSIGRLGGARAVSFLAAYLYDPEAFVRSSTASEIERITGEDFGIPKRQGPHGLDEGVEAARTWWEKHKGNWEQ